MGSLRQVTFLVTNIQEPAFKGPDPWQCRDNSKLGIICHGTTRDGALHLGMKMVELVLKEDPSCKQDWWDRPVNPADEVVVRDFLVREDGMVVSMSGPEGTLEQAWENAGSSSSSGEMLGGETNKGKVSKGWTWLTTATPVEDALFRLAGSAFRKTLNILDQIGFSVPGRLRG